MTAIDTPSPVKPLWCISCRKPCNGECRTRKLDSVAEKIEELESRFNDVVRSATEPKPTDSTGAAGRKTIKSVFYAMALILAMLGQYPLASDMGRSMAEHLPFPAAVGILMHVFAVMIVLTLETGAVAFLQTAVHMFATDRVARAWAAVNASIVFACIAAGVIVWSHISAPVTAAVYLIFTTGAYAMWFTWTDLGESPEHHAQRMAQIEAAKAAKREREEAEERHAQLKRAIAEMNREIKQGNELAALLETSSTPLGLVSAELERRKSTPAGVRAEADRVIAWSAAFNVDRVADPVTESGDGDPTGSESGHADPVSDPVTAKTVTGSESGHRDPVAADGDPVTPVPADPVSDPVTMDRPTRSRRTGRPGHGGPADPVTETVKDDGADLVAALEDQRVKELLPVPGVRDNALGAWMAFRVINGEPLTPKVILSRFPNVNENTAKRWGANVRAHCLAATNG